MSKELTLVQAWQALLNGECVAPDGYEPYKIKSGDLMIWYQKRWETAAGDCLSYDNHPFFIVPDPSKEPVKSLTFEEALKLYDEGEALLRVNSPSIDGDWGIHPQLDLHEPGEGTDLSARNTVDYSLYSAVRILLLDLAERRGWPITEVQ